MAVTYTDTLLTDRDKVRFHLGDVTEWWWRVNWDTSLADFDTGEITALGEAYRGLPIDYADLRVDVNDDGKVDILVW